MQASRVLARQDLGNWLILMAAVCWGTTGTAQAFAPSGATPLAVGTVRLLIGGAGLLLLAIGRRKLRPQGWPLRPTALAICTIAAYQVCFFGGVARTGVAVGTVVAIGSAPMLAGLFGLLLLGERPSRRWLVATLLAIAGCALLIGAGGADIQVDPLGIVLAIGAGASYALYTSASKELLPFQPPDAVTAVIFFGGALLLAPLLFIVDLSWLGEPRGLLVALELGLVATTLPYILYVRALLTVPTATAVTLALAEPLTAATLGVVVLHEQLTPVALAGMALLFAGLASLSVGGAPRTPVPDR
ncbi:MAG: EamA family transporter [Caldilineaceae bacterium]|nr:EamA family transporter [Caldilineaceae bacterium]